MKIPREILDKYCVITVEEIEQYYPDIVKKEEPVYRQFLERTDHIPNKIIEAQALGHTSEDYTEILNYRQFARDEINRLEA